MIHSRQLLLSTNQENTRRGLAGIAQGEEQKSKTHCPHGHLYSSENTIVRVNVSGKPRRDCRACANRMVRQWRANRKRGSR